MDLIQKIIAIPETTDQLLEVVLDGRPFILRILWNERFGYFSLSILDSDALPIIQNVKMVKNYPLIGRFSDVRLPIGDLFFIQDNGKTLRPEYSELGVTHSLYYYKPDDAAQVIEPATFTPNQPIGTIWDNGATAWDGDLTSWDQ